MTRQGWKGFMLAGLLGMTGLALGCSQRSKTEAREGAREAGQEVGKAAKDVKNAGKDATEGFREGWGGSGTDKNIGDDKVDNNKSVKNGQVPLEETH